MQEPQDIHKSESVFYEEGKRQAAEYGFIVFQILLDKFPDCDLDKEGLKEFSEGFRKGMSVLI